MMGDTYAKIAEIKNEWMRQVIVEQDQEDDEIDQSGERLDAKSGHDQYEANDNDLHCVTLMSWQPQWARTVLIVERGIAPAERLRQQDLYRFNKWRYRGVTIFVLRSS